MEKYDGSENFGPSHYDYDFDFDLDLRFGLSDYLLMVFYTVFVLPFEVLAGVVSQTIHRYKHHSHERDNQQNHSEVFHADFSAAPCCQWPRTSHIAKPSTR